MNIASPVILKLSSLQIAALQTQRGSNSGIQRLNQWTLAVLITDYLLITKYASEWVRVEVNYTFFTIHWISTKRTNCFKS